MKSLGHIRSIVVASLLFIASAPGLRAASGTWNIDAAGSWDTDTNWLNNTIPGGVDSTAFLTYNITADREITLGSNLTLGNITVDDPSGTSNNYFIISNGVGADTITLSTTTGTPTISVASGETLTLGRSVNPKLNIILAGTQGFVKTGTGTLYAFNAASDTLSGDVLLQEGTFNLVGNVKGALVMSASTTLKVAYSGGGNCIFYGLSSTESTARVVPSSNNRTLTLNGAGDYSYAGYFTGGAAATSVNLTLSMTGGGSQTLTNAGAIAQNNYNITTVNSGSLIHAANGATGTPFGIGNVIIGGTSGAGREKIVSTATSGSVAYTGVNAVAGSTFTYGNGAYLDLSKGTGGATGLSYTIGNASATANSVVVRTASSSAVFSSSGTLVVTPASGLASLGTASGEKFIVNGTVTNVNGIVNPGIIGRDNDANGSGSFLTYDATNGFVSGTYSNNGVLSGGTAFTDTRVFDVTSDSALVANAAVYALRSSGKTISGAFTLSVGPNSNATAPASIIMNGGAINTTTLALGDSAGIVYTGGTASIGAVITNLNGGGTTGRGITFEGPGVLTLSGTNTYYGGTSINETTVVVSANANLGNSGSGADLGQVSLKGGTLRATTDMTLTNRILSLRPGVTSGGGTFEVDATKTLTFTSGGTANDVTKIISGSSGSLTKTGAGTFAIGGTQNNTYGGGTAVRAGTLSVSHNVALGTGAVDVYGTGATAATQGTLLIASANTIANNITFSGGKVDRTVGAGSAYSLGTTGTVQSTLTGGITTGAKLLEANNATADTTISYSFGKTAPGGVTNDAARVSDIFALSNMEAGTKFVLQMNIATVTASNFLGWYNSTTTTWQNAVLGNSNAGTIGLTLFQGNTPYVAGTDFVLGYWGYDTTNNTVWAVIDHNSDFIVQAVPEPSTTALLVASAGALLLWAKRRRSL